jgi:FkbM family methyltransferase
LSLRDTVRAYRHYYKTDAFDLYRKAFKNHVHAWWFPFFGSGRYVPRDGSQPIIVPRDYWTMLATASRLVLIGAHPTWSGGTLGVSFRDLRFVAPATSNLIGLGLKGIYLDDLFRINSEDLAGKTVVDVGAYIGDSSVAFALRGAKVQAFEPLPLFQQYLYINARLNNVQDRITVHTVGLSDKTSRIQEAAELKALASSQHGWDGRIESARCEDASQGVLVVEALPYLQANGIGEIDILKLNCEGCEYVLFKDARLLTYLRPRRVIMEYHKGGESLHRFFRDQGYEVDWPNPSGAKGFMFAVRAHH